LPLQAKIVPEVRPLHWVIIGSAILQTTKAPLSDYTTYTPSSGGTNGVVIILHGVGARDYSDAVSYNLEFIFKFILTRNYFDAMETRRPRLYGPVE